jgi:hypothetical protein
MGAFVLMRALMPVFALTRAFGPTPVFGLTRVFGPTQEGSMQGSAPTLGPMQAFGRTLVDKVA